MVKMYGLDLHVDGAMVHAKCSHIGLYYIIVKIEVDMYCMRHSICFVESQSVYYKLDICLLMFLW